MPNKAELQKLCYEANGTLKAKEPCRAAMINTLILDEMLDIDEAEDFTDHFLRELHLWGEPRIEDLLRDDEPSETEPTAE